MTDRLMSRRPHLLPCPWCGNADPIFGPILAAEDGSGISPYLVECPTVHLDPAGDWWCAAQRWGDTLEQAAERWNIRAASGPAP